MVEGEVKNGETLSSKSQSSGNYCQKPFLGALSKGELAVFKSGGTQAPIENLSIDRCMYATLIPV